MHIKPARKEKARTPKRREMPAPPVGPPIAGIAYTESECAVFLRLSNKRTLSVWRCTGRAPNLKWRRLGGRIVYLGEDIIAFLNAEPSRAPMPVYTPKTTKARRGSAEKAAQS